MKRQEFFKACAAGVCGCGVLSLLTTRSLPAQETNTPQKATSPEVEQLKNQIDGARERFALLVSIMEKQLDEPTRLKLLQSLGHECASPYKPFFAKYQGKPQAFLEKIKTAWADVADYDEKKGVITVKGKPGPCACPLVKIGSTPKEFCRCSMGWNEEAFATVLDRPVRIELLESVLQDGTRCSFRIQIV